MVYSAKVSFVRNSTDRLSRNSQCEASKVNNAGMGSMVSHSLNKCEGSGFGECKAMDCSKSYSIRFVYNSSVIPKQVDALLARRPVKNCVNARIFKNRNVWGSMNAATKVSSDCVSKSVKCYRQVVRKVCQNDQSKNKECQTLSPAASTDKGRRVNQVLTAKVILNPDISDKPQIHSDSNTDSRISVNTNTAKNANSEKVLIYDANYSGVDNKFASSILHANPLRMGVDNGGVDTEIYKKWRHQSPCDFGCIPIDEQLMPQNTNVNEWEVASPWDVHGIVRATGAPNFMKARIPIKSQLKVQAWKDNLAEYWDQQLCQLVEFGFPLDFIGVVTLNVTKLTINLT